MFLDASRRSSVLLGALGTLGSFWRLRILTLIGAPWEPGLKLNWKDHCGLWRHLPLCLTGSSMWPLWKTIAIMTNLFGTGQIMNGLLTPLTFSITNYHFSCRRRSRRTSNKHSSATTTFWRNHSTLQFFCNMRWAWLIFFLEKDLMLAFDDLLGIQCSYKKRLQIVLFFKLCLLLKGEIWCEF